jgi:hypothetical protein
VEFVFEPKIIIDRSDFGPLSRWLSSKTGKACSRVEHGVTTYEKQSGTETEKTSNRIPWILFYKRDNSRYYLLISPDNIEQNDLKEIKELITVDIAHIIGRSKLAILIRNFTESDLFTPRTGFPRPSLRKRENLKRPKGFVI